jgi:hypothetical protein
MFENYKTATHLAPRGTDIFTASQWYTTQIAATGLVTPQALGLPGQQISYSGSPELLDYTAVTFSFLESLPENQTIIANLPASKRMSVSVELQGGQVLQVTLPLDGWGNPIFFVAGGGLGIVPTAPAPNGLVWLDGVNQGIVTSVRPIIGNALSTYAPATPGIQIANQPFFVSAGPDGFINNYHPNPSNTSDTSNCTDDNIYSFNN